MLGYNRQRIHANWKLYAENTRDNYHASLLHEFLVTFGLDRSTQKGGVTMDGRHRHNITWAEADSDSDDFARETYANARVRNDFLSLQEPDLVAFRRERDDNLNLVVTSVFPSSVFVQISNSLAVRQIRPRGVDEFEVFQTMLGYADDPPEMTRAPAAPGQSRRPSRARLDGGWRGDRDRPPRDKARPRPQLGHRIGRRRRHFRPRLPRHRRAVARLLVVLRRAVGHRAAGCGAMNADRFAIHDLLAEYGALLDMAQYDEWLGLFAAECRYNVVPRENFEQGLPVGLIFCDSRAMLEDRVMALREANKYNIHNDRHLIGLPRLVGADGLAIEAPFAVYQTDQEGATHLFATGLYRDRLERGAGGLKIRDKLVLLDTFAVPTLLATPL